MKEVVTRMVTGHFKFGIVHLSLRPDSFLLNIPSPYGARHYVYSRLDVSFCTSMSVSTADLPAVVIAFEGLNAD